MLCLLVAVPQPVAMAIGLGVSPSCEHGMKLWTGERCLAVQHRPLSDEAVAIVEAMWADACGAPDGEAVWLSDRAERISGERAAFDAMLVERGLPTAEHRTCINLPELLAAAGFNWSCDVVRDSAADPMTSALPTAVLDRVVPTSQGWDPPPPRVI